MGPAYSLGRLSLPLVSLALACTPTSNLSDAVSSTLIQSPGHTARSSHPSVGNRLPTGSLAASATLPTWHGGAVISGTYWKKTPVYIFYYGTWDTSGPKAKLLEQWINDLSDSSYSAMFQTYTDNRGTASESFYVAKTVNSGDYFAGDLTEASMFLMLNDYFSGAASPTIPELNDAIYLIVASPGVTVLNAKSQVLGTAGSGNTCSFHSHFAPIVNPAEHEAHFIIAQDFDFTKSDYQGICNPSAFPVPSAGLPITPNGYPGMDSMLAILSHEFGEIATDPDDGGWYVDGNSEHGEIGDLCGSQWNNLLPTSNGSQFNFQGRSGNQYLVQDLWLNRNSPGCTTSWADDRTNFAPSLLKDPFGGLIEVYPWYSDPNGTGMTRFQPGVSSVTGLADETRSPPAFFHDVGFQSLGYLAADINADGFTDVIQPWNNGGNLALQVFTGFRFSGPISSFSKGWGTPNAGSPVSGGDLFFPVSGVSHTGVGGISIQCKDVLQVSPSTGALVLQTSDCGAGDTVTLTNTWSGTPGFSFPGPDPNITVTNHGFVVADVDLDGLDDLVNMNGAGKGLAGDPDVINFDVFHNLNGSFSSAIGSPVEVIGEINADETLLAGNFDGCLAPNRLGTCPTKHSSLVLIKSDLLAQNAQSMDVFTPIDPNNPFVYTQTQSDFRTTINNGITSGTAQYGGKYLVGDFDGDGRDDVVQVSVYAGFVVFSWFPGQSFARPFRPGATLGTPTRTFTATKPNPNHLAYFATDFDGNGTQDVVEVLSDDDRLRMLGYPGPNFSPPINLLRATTKVSSTTSASVSPTPNNNGWIGVPALSAIGASNVTVSLTAPATLIDGGSAESAIEYAESGAQSLPYTISGSNPTAVSISTDGTTEVSYFADDLDGDSQNPQSTVVQLDRVPPTIGASLSPQQANCYGWNNVNVTVTFTCSDTLSQVQSCSGPVSFTTEGAGQIATGNATDLADNPASKQLPVNLDKTLPTITYSGSSGTYTVDQFVSITCSATDTLSGIPAKTCSGTPASMCNSIMSPAYVFNNGVNTSTASATDRAGNTATSSVSFVVIVTAQSLCHLAQRFTNNASVAASLCSQIAGVVTAPTAHARDGRIGAFDHHVDAQTGKTLDATEADVLKRWIQYL